MGLISREKIWLLGHYQTCTRILKKFQLDWCMYFQHCEEVKSKLAGSIFVTFISIRNNTFLFDGEEVFENKKVSVKKEALDLLQKTF
jgi:hypothetical protein